MVVVCYPFLVFLEAGGRVSARRPTHFWRNPPCGFSLLAKGALHARGLLTLRSKVTQTPKVSKRKASRASGPLRGALRCSKPAGGSETRAFGPQTSEPLDPPASALLSPAATAWGETSGHPTAKQPNSPRGFWGQHPQRRVVTNPPGTGAMRHPVFSPRRYAEASSADLGGSGLALSERSEFSQTPHKSSNAAYRRSRATHPARLFFAYFLLAKQKTSRSPAGARPSLYQNPARLLK